MRYDTLSVTCKPLENQVVMVFKPEKFQIMVYGMQLEEKSGVVCGHFTFFGKNDIAYLFPNPQIKSEMVLGCKNPEFSFCYHISSDVPVFGYSMMTDGVVYSDNGFHLFSGLCI